jgi:hypothetical protein
MDEMSMDEMSARLGLTQAGARPWQAPSARTGQGYSLQISPRVNGQLQLLDDNNYGSTRASAHAPVAQASASDATKASRRRMADRRRAFAWRNGAFSQQSKKLDVPPTSGQIFIFAQPDQGEIEQRIVEELERPVHPFLELARADPGATTNRNNRGAGRVARRFPEPARHRLPAAQCAARHSAQSGSRWPARSASLSIDAPINLQPSRRPIESIAMCHASHPPGPNIRSFSPTISPRARPQLAGIRWRISQAGCGARGIMDRARSSPRDDRAGYRPGPKRRTGDLATAVGASSWHRQLGTPSARRRTSPADPEPGRGAAGRRKPARRRVLRRGHSGQPEFTTNNWKPAAPLC